jgi:hypothetical protein
MKVRIEFEVESEEQYNMLKQSSELEGETWILLKKARNKK